MIDRSTQTKVIALPFARKNDIDAVGRLPLEELVPARSIFEMLEQSAHNFGDHAALTWLPNGSAEDRGEEFSFVDFLKHVTRTANLLRELGIGRDDAVTLLLPNLPETHFCLWGASTAGIAAPVNPLLQPSQIADIVRATGSRIIVTAGPAIDPVIWEKAIEVAAREPNVETLVVIGLDDGVTRSPATRIVDYRVEVGHARADDLNFERPAPDDISCYFHTGGTTGSPKIAPHTHRNQLFTAWSVQFALGLDAEDRILVGLPIFHVNAGIGTGLCPLLAGATILLGGPAGYRNRTLIEQFWRIAAKHRATVFSGVPTIFATLMDIPVNDADISSLRLAVCGAAPMPVSLFSRFEKTTGVKIIEVFGMTEGTAISTANPRDGERRIGSIGLVLPHQRLRVAMIDDAGSVIGDCGPGETGALLLNGPNVFPGYKLAAHNAKSWPEPGWFNSGDLAWYDEDGYFWLAGRAKDLIIRGGHNIDPAIVEEALQGHSAVEVAAAVGFPDAYAGELPVAYVKLRQGHQATADELHAHARESVTERAAAPVEIFLRDLLPVTAVGKLFKPVLREDAVSIAYQRALRAALPDDIAPIVTAHTDPMRGLRARIRVDASAERRDALASAIDECLSNFTIGYEIAWDS